MNEALLGRLEQVALRNIWSDEAIHFTPWLAKPENLKLLGETLGMELEPESEEVAVGPFWADIVCKDSTDGTTVLIENQIEKTDHSHLGQILTYTAGTGAQTIVWIASQFREEHRAALDWLNEHTTEEVSFFGLEIELWKIGQSPAAPKFNIISKPNDWSKGVRQQAAASGGRRLTEHKQLQFDFWSAFKPWLEEHFGLRSQNVRHQHWLNVFLGKSGFHLSAIASLWNSATDSYSSPELRVELYLTGPSAKERLEVLRLRSDEFKDRFDSTLIFHSMKENKSCKIYVRCDFDFQDKGSWDEAFRWLGKYLQQFAEVFGPIVRAL